MTYKRLTNHNDTYVGSNMDDVIFGLDGDDSIFGSNGDDEIHGGKGDDILRAGAGDDKLYGDAGDDIMTMYTGHEKFYGGAGIDTIDFYYATKGVKLDLENHLAKYNIGSKVYQVTFTDIEATYGSSHDDILLGDGKRNILRGGEGDDTVSGRGGDDFISSGNGDEIMTGGAGRDVFTFGEKPDAKNNFDTVTDFKGSEDRLAFDTDIFSIKGIGQTLHFANIDYQHLRTDQFQSGEGHVAGSANVRIIYDSADGILYYDSNGSKAGHLVEVADIGTNLDISVGSVFLYSL